MNVKLINSTPKAEEHLVYVARASSSRQDKTEEPEKLINYLIKNKHWSPFQHSYVTFEIKTSKAIAIQYLRHLSFTFQEFSQRYAEVTEIEPIEFRLQAEKNRQSSTEVVGIVEQYCVDLFGNKEVVAQGTIGKKDINDWLSRVATNLEKTLQLYKEGLELGIAKECARMILPMASSTVLYMTGSLRSWIHLLEIRDDSHAQKEAQEVARAIKKLFINEFPIISKALNYV